MRNGRTKKFMLENYANIERERDLYQRYFWDTQAGCKPDSKESSNQKHGMVRIELWRCGASHGGYVIIKDGSSPRIQYLDDAIESMRDNHSEHTAGLRTCLERLRVYRNVYFNLHT
jgi:hypothetical protein